MKIKMIILLLLTTVLYEARAQQILPLYNDSIPNSILKLKNDEQPTLEVFLPVEKKLNGTAVIIFPGGAYAFLAYKEEGTDIAKAFAQRGIAAFVVKYRLPRIETMYNKNFGPLMDAQQALKIVRSKSRFWGIDSTKIGVVGYSAGGHLASTLATHFNKSYIPNKEGINLRPNFLILAYPVISMKEELAHMGSRIGLIGMKPTDKIVNLFSNELQVSKNTPPTYLTHTGDDSLVDVNNSIVFYQALQKNGVDAELHLFPKGNHGFTQRLPITEWMLPMLDFMRREGFY